MPKPKAAPPWSDREKAIAIYFISRAAPHTVSSAVIMLRCSTDRSSRKCRDKVATIREEMQKKFNLADPYNDETKDYDHAIVDDYLSQLDIALEDLKALLTLDAEVLEIMGNHV